MALDAIPEPMGSRILRSIGLQPKSKSRRTPELVLARIASMPAGPLHFLTWVLVAVPLESLADPADGQEQDQEQEQAQEAAADEVSVADLLRGGGLARGAQHWPRSILALGVEGLWDQDYLTVEDRDELLAVLAGPDLPSVSTAPVPDRQVSAAESDASPVGTDRVASAQPSAGPELPQPDLRRLLGRAVDVALAPTASAAEVGRQVAGLEWLIDLDPVGPDVWFHYGRLLAHRDSSPARKPRGHDPRQQLVEGQFQGLLERGDHDRIVHFAGQHPEVVERVLGGEDPGEVPAGLLEAHVGLPRELARLLVMVRRPFRGWQTFARRSRAEAARLLAERQGSEAEILLSALEDRLMRWAAIDGAQAARCRAEGLATMVLRASCRRRRSDFAGAIHLLRDVDTEILDRAARDAADVEWAMAKAEFSGIEQLTFPSDSSRLQDRLEAARPHLDRVLQSDPAHLEANLLAGASTFKPALQEATNSAYPALCACELAAGQDRVDGLGFRTRRGNHGLLCPAQAVIGDVPVTHVINGELCRLRSHAVPQARLRERDGEIVGQRGAPMVITKPLQHLGISGSVKDALQDDVIAAIEGDANDRLDEMYVERAVRQPLTQDDAAQVVLLDERDASTSRFAHCAGNG